MPPTSPRKRPTREMQAGGSSAPWVKSLANQRRVANMFLAHVAETNNVLSEKWGIDIMDVPEECITTTEFFGHLATYLVEVYRISMDSPIRPGQLLGKKSAVTIWSGTLNQMYKRFSKSVRPETPVRALPARA